ncbi:hypothetical protein QBC42DRAFT_44833 [Cladorrhinum samala]|uniref:Secreted protein n=1 Tax=Cladorrhinum samala TaxID=585594 RepID=A0AAV9HDM6_9PEZI|nr:hypothetical protein QBC42DRAFT_44833 [Cladorrhinum samala]
MEWALMYRSGCIYISLAFFFSSFFSFARSEREEGTDEAKDVKHTTQKQHSGSATAFLSFQMWLRKRVSFLLFFYIPSSLFFLFFF